MNFKLERRRDVTHRTVVLDHARAAVAAAALVALALVCAGAASAQQVAPPDYVIGPRDLLAVQVFGEPSVSGSFRVEGDGDITMPLIGRVTAGGRTAREAEDDIRQRLANGFFRDPQVSASVQEFGSKKVFVMGEVRNPGSYPLSGETTLLAAVAMAGSMLPSAGDTVVVMRAKPGSANSSPSALQPADELARVDLRDLQAGLARGQNVMLQHGDTVFVPKPEQVFVTGHVRNAGAFAYQRGLTVQQALAMAGGMTERGATSRLRITRKVKGVDVELKVKPNDVVQPGDTILVKERFF